MNDFLILSPLYLREQMERDDRHVFQSNETGAIFCKHCGTMRGTVNATCTDQFSERKKRFAQDEQDAKKQALEAANEKETKDLKDAATKAIEQSKPRSWVHLYETYDGGQHKYCQLCGARASDKLDGCYDGYDQNSYRGPVIRSQTLQFFNQFESNVVEAIRWLSDSCFAPSNRFQ